MRPPAAALDPGRPDQLGPLEPVETVVDDRPADRPDLAELAAGASLSASAQPWVGCSATSASTAQSLVDIDVKSGSL